MSKHAAAARPRSLRLIAAAGAGAVLALVLGVAGSATAASSVAVSSPVEAQAALDQAQQQLDAVRGYLKTLPTTPPSTTPPPSSTPTSGPTTDPTTAPTTDQPADPTTPATPPPTIGTPPPAAGGDTTSAAVQRGWGVPVAGDEFNTGVKPDARWGMYNGPGHAGNGRRTPTAFSITGGTLRVHGDTNGNSGGMAYRGGQFQGRWEARVRNSGGDPNYHPVLLLWPDAEDFPVGGEVDYMEIFDRSQVEFFLHYGVSNHQSHGARQVDTTQWHNYAVEWTTACVRGFVDNVEFFSDCNRGHLPPRAMHATIQLDAFGGDSGYTPTDMHVDWIRQYRL